MINITANLFISDKLKMLQGMKELMALSSLTVNSEESGLKKDSTKRHWSL